MGSQMMLVFGTTSAFFLDEKNLQLNEFGLTFGVYSQRHAYHDVATNSSGFV